MRMIALAKDDSIAYWRKELPNASETDLEMMYTHLPNGMMHIVVEGYDKYSKDGADYEIISADNAGYMCYSYRFRIRGLRRGH